MDSKFEPSSLHPTILRLPDAILKKMLNHLETDIKRELMTTCSRFADIMPFNGIDLTFFDPARDSDKEVYRLMWIEGMFEPPRRPNVDWDRITRALSDAEQHTPLATFRTVKLENYVITTRIAEMLSATFPHMVYLVLCGRYGVMELQSLHCFPNLKALSTWSIESGHESVGAQDLAVLAGLVDLQITDDVSFLTCEFQRMIGDTVIPGIRRFSCSFCTQFSREDALFLSRALPNVKEVTLGHLSTGLDMDWLRVFSKLLEVLKILNSLYNQFSTTSIASELGLRTLCVDAVCRINNFSFPQHLCCLEELMMWSEKQSINDIELLPESVSLTYLDISYTKAICDELLEMLLARRYPLKFLVANRNIPPFYIWVYAHEDGCTGSGYECLCHDSLAPGDCGEPVLGFSSTALAEYLAWNPGLQVLSVNHHSGVDDSVFAQDCASFKSLEYLRMVGTGCTADGISQLCHHRNTALAAGNTLPLLNMSVTSEVGNRYEAPVENGFLVVKDDPMWLSKAEVAMMSFLAVKDIYKIDPNDMYDDGD